MSYSFGVRAASKAEAKQRVAAKFDEVVGMFPMHARDRQQAQAAAEGVIDALADEEGKDVVASVSGWISWTGSEAAGDAQVAGVNVSASANLVMRDPA